MAGEQTIAQRVRAKYPGQYDDLSDTELETKVLAKYPDYKDLPRTQAAPAAPEGKGVGTHIAEGVGAFGKTVVGAVDSMGRAIIPEFIGEPIGLGKTGPVNALNSLLGAQWDTLKAAKEAHDRGDDVTAFAKTLYGVMPGIGPGLSHAADALQAGDIGEGLGETLGNAALMVGPKAIGSAVKAAMPKGPSARLAASLEKGASDRYVDVMAPKVGANKVRLGNVADRVAPQLASDPKMGAWTREGLHAKVSSKLADAEAALDSVADARNAKRVWHTKPILKALQSKLDDLTAQTVRQGATKAGEDVVPAPSTQRAAQIRKAMAEVEALGPVANYEALRRIRASWDGPAKAKYNSAVTSDYLAKQGEASGAADVTGVLREKLAGFEPATAKANADYSLARAAHDVLEATAEVERVRPRVGRQIMTRLTTTVGGGVTAGVPGAAAGFVLAPVIDAAMSTGATTKLATAQTMMRLARAIRKNDVAAVHTLSTQLQRSLARASAAGPAHGAARLVPSHAEQREP